MYIDKDDDYTFLQQQVLYNTITEIVRNMLG